MSGGELSAWLALLQRDLRIALRRRADTGSALVFFVIVASLFPLGVGPQFELLRRMGAGVVWVAALLASMLALGRLFADDHADGTLEQMLLSPTPLPLLVLAKTAAHWLSSGLLLVLVSPLLALQFDLGAPAAGVLWGTWLIIVVGAAFTGGNRTTSLSAVPVLIVLVGWLFGMRHALIMTATSILALLGMSLSEQYDWLPMGGSSPPLSRWMVLSNVLLLTAFLTLHSRRLYLSRYQALHRLSATLGLLTEGTPIMLAAVDGRGCYSYVNQNYAHFHGLAPTALRGSLVDAVLGDGIQQHNLARLDAGGGSATFRSRRHNRQTGDERWIETCLRSATATDGRTDGYYALLRDITDEVRTEEEIRFLAYHDALTGLPNRILLADRLRVALAHSKHARRAL